MWQDKLSGNLSLDQLRQLASVLLGDRLSYEENGSYCLSQQEHARVEMDDKKFLADLEELLEADAGTVKYTTELNCMAKWDSLAFVSFLAMADSKYGVKVAPKDLRKCKKVGDLIGLLDK